MKHKIIIGLGIAALLTISCSASVFAEEADNIGQSIGECESSADGYGISYGESWNKGSSESMNMTEGNVGYCYEISENTSETDGFGFHIGHSEGSSIGHNMGMSDPHCISSGESYSVGYSESGNIGHGSGIGESIGYSEGRHTMGFNVGENHGISCSEGVNYSEGGNIGYSSGTSESISHSSGANIGIGSGRSESCGHSITKSGHKRTWSVHHMGYRRTPHQKWSHGCRCNDETRQCTDGEYRHDLKPYTDCK